MPFYADDFGSVATAHQNARLMLCLELWSPGFGYTPTAPTSLYVCDAREEAAAREIFFHYRVNIKFAQEGGISEGSWERKRTKRLGSSRRWKSGAWQSRPWRILLGDTHRPHIPAK